MKHYFGNKKYTNGNSFRIDNYYCEIMTSYSKGQPFYISSDGLRMLEVRGKVDINFYMYCWTGYGWEATGNAGNCLKNALTWLSTGNLFFLNKNNKYV